MPATQLVFFCDEDGEAPVLEWLEKLHRTNFKAWLHCWARLGQLEQAGHELRRPAADFLRDGIYELRAKQGHVQYRILYFFHGRNVAVLAHSLTKEDRIPPAEIDRALARKRLFESKPKEHSYEKDTD